MRRTPFGREASAAPPRPISARLVADADHYALLVRDAIGGAKVSVWISTANVKEMRVEAPVGTTARARGGSMSILETLAGLASRGVELRLLHAGTPSRAFRAELRRHAPLRRGFAMRRCPRVHLKMIAVDGRLLYLGSANFTGAGLGAKGDGRRNFEMGILTDDDVMLDAAQARFEAIWSGGECSGCQCLSVCPLPLHRLPNSAGRGRGCTDGPSSSRRSER